MKTRLAIVTFALFFLNGCVAVPPLVTVQHQASDSTSLKKRVDDLEQRVRELEARVR